MKTIWWCAAMLCMPMQGAAQAQSQERAQERAQERRAELSCVEIDARPTYRCRIALYERGRAAGAGKESVMIGFAMPSMPMAHMVRPVTAAPMPAVGQYMATVRLPMRGMWMVRIGIGTPPADWAMLHVDFSGRQIGASGAGP